MHNGCGVYNLIYLHFIIMSHHHKRKIIVKLIFLLNSHYFITHCLVQISGSSQTSFSLTFLSCSLPQIIFWLLGSTQNFHRFPCSYSPLLKKININYRAQNSLPLPNHSESSNSLSLKCSKLLFSFSPHPYPHYPAYTGRHLLNDHSISSSCFELSIWLGSGRDF